MKTLYVVIVTFGFCLLALPGWAWPSPGPSVYYLQHFDVADTSAQSVWLVTQSQNGNSAQDVVYSSLASPTLHAWVGTLPSGSIIWYQVGGPYLGELLGVGSPKGAKIDHHVKPGDLDLYGFSLPKGAAEQFQDFYRFCQTKKVAFQVSAGPGGFM